MHSILESGSRRDPVVIAQSFLLFIRFVFRDHIATERQSSCESVVGLNFIGGGGHVLAHFPAANLFQEVNSLEDDTS